MRTVTGIAIVALGAKSCPTLPSDVPTPAAARPGEASGARLAGRRRADTTRWECDGQHKDMVRNGCRGPAQGA
ncbi:hypothetical protein; putative signal peptide [Frankia alni ACN14a]|uniref:Uncharacterized protein n=1 Tax=Frankia alni (strain DSM 45986 / CECT 9034 / ACN14a) TaxID=326424 RepID=Q0RJT9_FRAAA|nr:hypothetical protein; putative signal peptide [Frankia alni ACN14a]